MSVSEPADLDVERLRELMNAALADVGHGGQVKAGGVYSVTHDGGVPADLFVKAGAFALLQMGRIDARTRCSDHLRGAADDCEGIAPTEVVRGNLRCGR